MKVWHSGTVHSVWEVGSGKWEVGSVEKWEGVGRPSLQLPYRETSIIQ
jgi:hypothetical protein